MYGWMERAHKAFVIYRWILIVNKRMHTHKWRRLSRGYRWYKKSSIIDIKINCDDDKKIYEA